MNELSCSYSLRVILNFHVYKFPSTIIHYVISTSLFSSTHSSSNILETRLKTAYDKEVDREAMLQAAKHATLIWPCFALHPRRRRLYETIKTDCLREGNINVRKAQRPATVWSTLDTHHRWNKHNIWTPSRIQHRLRNDHGKTCDNTQLKYDS